MRSIGFPELCVILVVVVLLFGTKKIPDFAKGLGEGIRNFKDAIKGDDEKEAVVASGGLPASWADLIQAPDISNEKIPASAQ